MISWNVSGLRAAAGKTFFDAFHELDVGILCIQELKLQGGQIELDLPGYYDYWNYAEKRGYSGVAIFTEEKPVNVSYGFGIPEHDKKGRVIIPEFLGYYVLTCYTPNSQNELKCLDYRMEWEDAFFAYIKSPDQKKPLTYCGDLNAVYEEIDLKNPSTNRRNAGFTDEEHEKMTRVLTNGFVDDFRYPHPEEKDAYSWWPYWMKAGERNVGWHINYFIVSERLRDRIQGASIHSEILGSGHCPVELKIDL